MYRVSQTSLDGGRTNFLGFAAAEITDSVKLIPASKSDITSTIKISIYLGLILNRTSLVIVIEVTKICKS